MSLRTSAIVEALGGTLRGDPERRIGFSYCGNRMAPIADTGPFAGPLIEAMYASV